MATINKEIAHIIGVLSKQWLASDNPPRHRSYRFGYALVGSFSFFLTVVFARSPVDIKVIAFDPSFTPLYLAAITMIVIPSAWFAWLVSWRDSGYGPVRLYFSGLTLPTLTFWIISRVIEIN